MKTKWIVLMLATVTLFLSLPTAFVLIPADVPLVTAGDMDPVTNSTDHAEATPIPVDLSIQLVGPSEAPPDTYISYELQATNQAEVTARGVVVTITLPEALSAVASTLGSGLTATDQQVIWSVDRLLPDASRRAWFTAHITHTLAYGTVLTTTAEIGAREPESAPADNTIQTAVSVSVPNRRVAIPGISVEEGWETLVTVQNLGPVRSGALAFVRAEIGECGSTVPGPSAVLGTGTMSSCAGWTWSTNQLPDGARSALVYAISEDQMARALADANAAVGDFAAWQAWEEHWADGAYGYGAPLGVQIERRRPHPIDPEALMAAAYTGIAGMTQAAPAPPPGEYEYAVPSIAVGPGERTTELSIQNAGDECTTAEVVFEPFSTEAITTTVGPIPPGGAITVDPADVLPSPFSGGAWIRSAQPLAIVADDIDPAQGLMAAYQALPRRYSMDGADPNQLLPDTLHAPVVFLSYQGWDTEISVQNLSPAETAKVKLYFLTLAGDIVKTVVFFLGPGNAVTVPIQMIDGLPQNAIMTARIESQAWWQPGEEPGPPQPIQGVVRLVNTAKGQSAAYAAVPWSSSAIAVSPRTFGLPSLDDQTELFLTSSQPGQTSLRLDMCDQSGVFDLVCKLAADGQLVVSQPGAFLSPGNRGNGRLIALTGDDPDRAPALAAVALNRTQSLSFSEDPTDAAVAYEPVPLAFSYVRPPADLGTCPLPATPESTFTPAASPTATPTTTSTHTPTSTVTSTPSPSATPSPTATSTPTLPPQYIRLPLILRQFAHD